MSKLIDRIIFAGLLLAVFLSPWLFGSVEFYAVDLLAALLLVLLLLWAVKATVEQKLTLALTPIHWVFLSFLLFAWIQSLPLGLDLHRAAFGEVPGELVSQATGAISLDPTNTQRAAMKLAMLVGYFFLATHFIVGRRRLSLAIIVLMLLGFSLALVGMIHKLTSNGLLLWFRQIDAIEIAFGPFVNRNHFAGYMEMLIPLPLAVILARGVDRDKWLLYGLIAVILGMALVAASSRGGVIVLAAELLMLPIMAMKQRERQLEMIAPRIKDRASFLKTMAVMAVITIGILVGVVWIGAEPVVSRFSLATEGPELPLTDRLSRPAIWKNTLRMIKDNAVLGIGLGAYPIAYARYDDSSGIYRVEQAHNDYLQIIADAGLVGAACLVAFIIVVVRAASQALLQSGPVERSLALGATIGCLGIGVHSLFDFNLQVTSNALLFLLLIALLVNLAGKSVVSSPLSVAESYGRRTTDDGQEF